MNTLSDWHYLSTETTPQTVTGDQGGVAGDRFVMASRDIWPGRHPCSANVCTYVENKLRCTLG